MSSIQMQGGVVILSWPNDPVDEDAIRFEGIKNPVSLVGSPPNSVSCRMEKLAITFNVYP